MVPFASEILGRRSLPKIFPTTQTVEASHSPTKSVKSVPVLRLLVKARQHVSAQFACSTDDAHLKLPKAGIFSQSGRDETSPKASINSFIKVDLVSVHF